MKNFHFEKQFLLPLNLCVLGLLAGVLGGFTGAAFAILLSFVTTLRETTPWLILFLPLGGIATILLYRKFGLINHRGTNEMTQCLKEERNIPFLIAPLIFISTAITHLFGGSAGKEGASLQLGGAGSSAISDVLKLKGIQRTVFILCGMSAVFASVFGTPLTAAFFVLEFKSNKRVISLAVLPCLISAIVAKLCALFLGVTEKTMHLNQDISFSFSILGKILVLAIALSLLGTTMCFVFEKAQTWAKKIISNPLARVLSFALLLIILTTCVGDMRYNGSGMDMALNAIGGNTNWFDFILKLLFTSITIAAGFKGGEIVPTFCIGATFGCFLGGILGLDIGLAAALGLVGLFCCATNSFISAIFLSMELFGFCGLPYFILICLILWLLSVNNGLFQNRFFTSPFLTKSKKQPPL